MSIRPIPFLSGQFLTAAYQEGSHTPLAECQALWQRLKQYNPAVNAFSYLAEAESLEMARASTLRWQQGKALSPIDGWPISIKDSFLMRGWPMHAGSTIGAEGCSQIDIPVVQHLRAAGAVLFAKTTMPQWGWKGATESTVTGITRNPWNLNKTCGGSSGGAGVAVALGLGVAAIGTDGGGSIRIPGAFCGVIGYKPTHDVFPRYPLRNLAQLVDVGILARNVADIETLLPILNQADDRAMNYVPLGKCTSKALHHLAYSADLGFAELDPEVASIFERSITILKQHFDLTEKTPPVGDYLSAFARLWEAGCYESYAGLNLADQQKLDVGFVRIAKEGEKLSLLDYLQAETTRLQVAESMQSFLSEYDALLTPTVPIPAFNIGLDSPNEKSTQGLDNWTPFTCLLNMTGQPSITVPCGVTTQGLPVGLQISGAKCSDWQLLDLSQKITALLQFDALPPLLNPV